MLANITAGNSVAFTNTNLVFNPGSRVLTVIGGVNAASYTANVNVAAVSSTGAYNYGALSFTDTNVIAQYTGNANTFVQSAMQNTSALNNASADFIVYNNLGNATSYYGDFGINSNTFAGTGSLSLPNATYLYATNGDLVLGTGTANNIRFVINNGATDALTIFTTNTTVYSNLVISASSNGLFFPDGTFMSTAASGTGSGLTLGQTLSLQQNLAMP
jgi:hypothetical protein